MVATVVVVVAAVFAALYTILGMDAIRRWRGYRKGPTELFLIAAAKVVMGSVVTAVERVLTGRVVTALDRVLTVRVVTVVEGVLTGRGVKVI